MLAETVGPTLSATEKRLLNRLQDGLPLCERPFAAIAAELNLSESEIIANIERWLASGLLTRFGPMYRIDKAGGLFVLAALAVPPARFNEVAAMVNDFDEVAHNYERDHTYNMWFVLAVETPSEAERVFGEIERQTQLPVLRLPKLNEYFVDLRFLL